MRERRDGLARDTALSALGLALSGGAQFVVSALVGRVVGPASLGTFRTGLAVANAASLLWPAAAGQSASLFVARGTAASDAPGARGVERHLMRRTAWIVPPLALAAAALAVQLLGMQPLDAAWVAALVVTFSAYHLARGIRFGRRELTTSTAWEGAAAATTVALTALVLVLEQPGYYLVPMVAGYGLYAISIIRPAGPGRVLTAGERAELDGFVLWGVTGSLASAGLLQYSMMVAAGTLSSADAGLYAAAISLATPISMLTRSLSMALFPELARQRGRGDEAAMRASTDRVTRGLVALMVPALGSTAIAAEPLIRLIYGPEFLPAVLPLRLLLLAVLLTTATVAAVNSINVRGRRGVRESAVMSWIGLGLGVPTMILLIRPLGMAGVAVGYLVGATTTAALAYLRVWRRDRPPWGSSTVLLLGAVAAVFGLINSGAGLASWTDIAVPLLVFLLSWATLAAATGLLRGAVSPETL